MKRIFTLMALVLVLFSQAGYAQPCSTNPMPLPICSSNPQDQNFFCCGELEGLTGTMLGPLGGAGEQLCPSGGVVNNITWVSFIAAEQNVTISLVLSDCNTVMDPNGDMVSGAQFGVYSECGDLNSQVACDAGQNGNGSYDIQLTNLIPGEVYHMFLDGFSGSQCDYAFSVVGNIIAPIPQNPTQFSGLQVVCPSAMPTYSATLGQNSNITIWSAMPSDVVLVDNGDGTATVTDWGATGASGGTVQICGDGVNDCYPMPDGMTNCYNVTIQTNQQITLPDVSLCPAAPGADVVYSWPEIPGSMYQGSPFPGTTYMETLPDQSLPAGSGCMIEYTFTVIAYPIEEPVFQENLCPEQLPFDIDGVAYNPNPTLNLAGIPLSTLDANGCTQFATIDLSVVDVGLNFSVPNGLEISCGNNGAITIQIIPTNSTAIPNNDVSFSWTTDVGAFMNIGSGIGDMIEITAPGVYTFTAFFDNVDDTEICTVSNQFTVTEVPGGATVSTTQVSTSCAAATDGSATATGAGGAAPFTYTWDAATGGQTGPTATGLAAGTYSVTAQDAGGCTAIGTVEVTVGAGGFNGTTSTTPSSCGTGLNGTATINVTNGTGTITYTWGGAAAGQTGSTATGLNPGTYDVTAEDASGCQVIETITVLSTPSVTFDPGATIQNVLCFGETTGSATVNATGGTGNLTYTWDAAAGSQSGPTASSLGVGTYSVTAEDTEGCQDITSVTITQPASALNATVLSTSPSGCGVSTGTITIDVTGGTTAYSFAWSDGTTTTQNLSNAASGVYQVTITDAGMCEFILSGTVGSSNGPSITSITETPVSCNGFDDGAINLAIADGLPPYTIVWSGPTGIPNDEVNPTGLAPGSYSAAISDANGCEITGAATITEEPPVSGTVNSTNTTCGGATGSLQLTPLGGLPPYTFMWDNGAGIMEDPDMLPAGVYNVTIFDANLCEAYATGTIMEPGAPDGTSSSTNVSCFNESDGTIIIDITTAGSFDYDWVGYPGLSGASNGGLAPGTYDIVVTDLTTGCAASFQEIITQPDEIITIIDVFAVECFDQPTGSATMTVDGGSGSGYTFTWCNGSNDQNPTDLPPGPCSVIVVDGGGCPATFTVDIPNAALFTASLVAATDALCFGESTGTIDIDVVGGAGGNIFTWTPTLPSDEDQNMVPAGIYNVEIEDANGCTAEVLNIVVGEPGPLTVTSSTMDASCNMASGSIDLEVSGGTPMYNYAWTPALPNQPDHIGTVASGTYTVIITDAQQCEITETVTVEEPGGLTVTNIAGTDVTCIGDSDGTITLEVDGGSGPGTYNYVWNPALPNQANHIGLPVGTYDVTITDVSLCELLSSVTIGQPDPIVISMDAQVDPSCTVNDGLLTVSAVGGNGSLTYDWGPGLPMTPTISDLGAGSYTVNVSDPNGCSSTETFSLIAPGGFTASHTFENISCSNLTDGTITITTVGGSGTFNYVWSGPTAVGNTPNGTGLAEGNYNITITDEGTGCPFEIAGVVITTPDAFIGSAIPVDASCLNNDGSIDATVQGGTGAITYSWTGLGGSYTSMDEDIIALAEGQYILTATDAMGCQATVIADVGIPTAPTITAVASDALCFGQATGGITTTVNGANGNVTYTWSVPSVGDSPIAVGLTAAGSPYTVSIIDEENCQATVSQPIIINEPALIQLSSMTLDAACGQANGSIDLTVIGGIMPYSYSWSNGLPNQEDHTGTVTAGPYDVTVTDANLCPMIGSAIVGTPNAVTATSMITDADCFGGSNGTITLTVSGGNPGYSYAWSGPTPIGDTPNATDLSAGIYEVVITDIDNCPTVVPNIFVGSGTQITVANPVIEDANCGDFVGSILINPAGGVGPYSYSWNPAQGDTNNPSFLAGGNYQVTITDALGCNQVENYVVANIGAPNFDELLISDNLCASEVGGSSVTIPNITSPNPFTIDWMQNEYDGMDMVADLPSADYSGVVIDDVTGCEQPFSFTIGSPPPLAVEALTNQAVECFGDASGVAVATAMGGLGSFDYQWEGPGGVTATGENPTDLIAGMYIVVVEDDNGCTAESSVTIDQPLAPLEVTGIPTNLSCNGIPNGTISLTTVGGTMGAGYDYTWNLPQYNGNDNLTGLGAGQYSVVVTDAMGCPSDPIAFEITEPAPILVDAALSEFAAYNVSCYGETDGSITTAVSGGVGQMNYMWSNGATTANLDSIGQGDYSLVVTDGNGCPSAELLVNMSAPSQIVPEIASLDVRCAGDTNGAIFINDVVGGAGPFDHNMMDGPVTNGNFNGLSAGIYEVVTTDANGCTTVTEATIVEPDSVLVTFEQDEIELIFGDSILLNPEVTLGGAQLSIFEWSNNILEDCPTGDCPSVYVNPMNSTSYKIFIQDENGCFNEDEVQVRVKKPRNVYFPNVFNPNSTDGFNAVFQPRFGAGVVSLDEFIVVDRWGEILFRIPKPFSDTEFNASSWGWNGTLRNKGLNPGVYVYYAKVRFVDGEVIEYGGDVTLLK